MMLLPLSHVTFFPTAIIFPYPLHSLINFPPRGSGGGGDKDLYTTLLNNGRALIGTFDLGKVTVKSVITSSDPFHFWVFSIILGDILLTGSVS